MFSSIVRYIAWAGTFSIGCGFAALILTVEILTYFFKAAVKLTKPVWIRLSPSPLRQTLAKWIQPRIVASDVLKRKVDPTQVPSFLMNPEIGDHRYMVTSDGCKLHYVIKKPSKSSTNDKLLICLHGFPEFWYPWIPFLQHFSSYYTVVALDMRGYGHSEKPPHSWFDTSAFSVKRLAKDVDELITHLGYQKANIVSHDWGGIVSWEFAQEYNQRLEKLVVMACPHPKAFVKNFSPKQFLKSWYMFFFQVPIFTEMYLTKDECHALAWGPFLSREMGPRKRHLVTLQDLEAYTWNAMQPQMCSATVSYIRELLRNPLPKRSPGKTRGKILVYVPEKDGALNPSLYRNLDKFCQDVQVRHLPDCSHWVLYDALDTLIPECYDFLDVPKEFRQSKIDFYRSRVFSSTHSNTSVLSKLEELLAEWKEKNLA